MKTQHIVESAFKADTLVLVADAARARIFRSLPDESHKFTLRELEVLVHPIARVPERQRYSAASSFAGNAGSGHTFGEQRENNDLEERRRFAKTVAVAVERIASEHLVKHLLVVATHSMQALLLHDLERTQARKLDLVRCTAEMSELSPQELRAALVERNLLPGSRVN
jgi:protein required for attachment to host cells